MRLRVALPAAFLAITLSAGAYVAYAHAHHRAVHGHMLLALPALPWDSLLPLPHNAVGQWAVWVVALLPNALLLGLTGHWLDRARPSRPAG